MDALPPRVRASDSSDKNSPDEEVKPKKVPKGQTKEAKNKEAKASKTKKDKTEKGKKEKTKSEKKSKSKRKADTEEEKDEETPLGDDHDPIVEFGDDDEDDNDSDVDEGKVDTRGGSMKRPASAAKSATKKPATSGRGSRRPKEFPFSKNIHFSNQSCFIINCYVMMCLVCIEIL